MTQNDDVEVAEACVAAYRQMQHRLLLFVESVARYFSQHPTLSVGDPPAVHSVKWRLKDPQHLSKKIVRKNAQGKNITVTNLFDLVTDLGGVRVYHLHLEQFRAIHAHILSQVESGDWFLSEPPKALGWDPEAREFFESVGLTPEIRPTFYTSVHYLVRPTERSQLCCEIQVRTLFEEIWGEIDHMLNYPDKTSSIACHEQLRTLAKLVGTGGRLVDSIIRSHREHAERTGPRPE